MPIVTGSCPPGRALHRLLGVGKWPPSITYGEWHHRCVVTLDMASASGGSSPTAGRVVSYHGAVSEFKRRLIEATLHQMRGNRTHTARVLGLQRTYLLRLIRELGVAAPPPPPRRRSTPA